MTSAAPTRLERPIGRLVVVALAATRHPGQIERAYVALHHRFGRLLDCRPIPVRDVLADAGSRVRQARVGVASGLPVDHVLAEPVDRSA
ncbi:MAG: hypothetical protein S0880_28450 [Actinomycetota bacterium]|nr:hypothetical protein [Actinomycetota bacterium]